MEGKHGFVPVMNRFGYDATGLQGPMALREKVDGINNRAREMGNELLGREVVVHQYREGLGRTRASRKGAAVVIDISDAPVTTLNPHGEQIMMGLALHEIGHHLNDVGARGHRTMRGIARSEGLREIYDILIDERLERIMRSRRPEWGPSLTASPRTHLRKRPMRWKSGSTQDWWIWRP